MLQKHHQRCIRTWLWQLTHQRSNNEQLCWLRQATNLPTIQPPCYHSTNGTSAIPAIKLSTILTVVEDVLDHLKVAKMGLRIGLSSVLRPRQHSIR